LDFALGNKHITAYGSSELKKGWENVITNERTGFFFSGFKRFCTDSPAVARKSRPYCLRSKPSVRLSITEKSDFLQITVPRTLC